MGEMNPSQTNGLNIQIPVIDLSHATAQTADRLIDAVSRYGFVFVKGEGLGFTSQILDDTFALSKSFFASPIEEKRTCAISANNIGWSSMHAETLDPKHQKKGDFKEAINFGEFIDGKAQQALAPAIAPHEANIYHFYGLCHELCVKLLKLFALGLKIDPSKGGEDFFASRHDPSKGPSGRILRLLHYPAVGKDESAFDNVVDIRAGAHSDYGKLLSMSSVYSRDLTDVAGSLTLLFQRAGQPGLEVLSPTESWSAVPVYPPGTESDAFPPILVNIGDLMQFWTAGVLKSTVHRVVFPQGESEDRYSIAYFCHPLDEVEIEAVPSEMIRTRNEMSKQHDGEIITAEGYLKKRLAETYGWGKEQSPTL